MSEPEISHRCVSCGTSIRQAASFCPECGKPLVKLDDTIAIERPSPLDSSAPTVALGDGNGVAPKAAASEMATQRLDEALLQAPVATESKAEPDLDLSE